MKTSLVMLCTLVYGMVLLGSAPTAKAHAAPAKITPGNGAILNAGPDRVVIEMSQEMTRQAGANDIDVFGPSGTEVTTEAAVLDSANRRLLSVALPAPLAPGKYVVKWKTLSADDGDPAEGNELSFTVDPNATPVAGTEVVREDTLGGNSPTAAPQSAPKLAAPKSKDGVTWVLAVAVGLGAFVLGAGGTFLLVDRHPTGSTKGKQRP